jgi:CRP-like cAMP-binding protein
MPESQRLHMRGENHLLASLSGREHDRLWPRLEKVSLRSEEIVHDPHQAISHVYFPLTGVYSLLIVLADGVAVEAASTGNEGMIGTPVFLGTDRSPTRAGSQIAGDSLRMEAEDFRQEMRRAGPLYGLVQRFIQGLVTQISQSAACNHRHSVEQRLCRWLLLTDDRVGTDGFAMTHEFLARTLGVRRPTVTAAAGILQKAGFIHYHRGRMTIRDREGLKAASCECYRLIANEFDRLLT